MVAMADQNDAVTLAGVPDDFQMHFRHERTGRIDNSEITPARLIPDVGCDAMGAEDGDGTIWNFVEILDENSALRRKFIHNESIVDDFLADIDRPPELGESNSHDV